MTSEIQSLVLTIPSDLAWLTVARDFVENVCQAARLVDADTRAIVLASNEAISNVIRHAHGDVPEARLQIECRVAADRMEVILSDQGKPFDIAAVPDLDPADLRIGGRGVYLMRILMDELSSQPKEGDGGNLLRMVKHRQPNTAE